MSSLVPRPDRHFISSEADIKWRLGLGTRLVHVRVCKGHAMNYTGHCVVRPSHFSPPFPPLHPVPCPLLQLVPLAPALGGACGRCAPPTECAQSQECSSHLTCSQIYIGGGRDDWAGEGRWGGGGGEGLTGQERGRCGGEGRGLTGQERGRCGGEGRGLTGQGIKGQVGRRGKRGAYLARGGVGGEERDEQKMWTCMT